MPSCCGSFCGGVSCGTQACSQRGLRYSSAALSSLTLPARRLPALSVLHLRGPMTGAASPSTPWTRGAPGQPPSLSGMRHGPYASPPPPTHPRHPVIFGRSIICRLCGGLKGAGAARPWCCVCPNARQWSHRGSRAEGGRYYECMVKDCVVAHFTLASGLLFTSV